MRRIGPVDPEIGPSSFFDLCHGVAQLIVVAHRAMGRTRRELMFRIWGLSCRAHEAVGMPLRDPATEVYLFNMVPLKRTHKADLNIPGEILARFCNFWMGLCDLVTEPSADTQHG